MWGQKGGAAVYFKSDKQKARRFMLKSTGFYVLAAQITAHPVVAPTGVEPVLRP